MNLSEGKNQKSKFGRARKGLAAIAAAAAIFVLCFGGYNLLQRDMTPAVDSVVLLDVNPSLSLSVDAEEKVLAVEALNADAEEVLGSMELKDTSLEVAVNAIIGSMLQKGYLGDLQNAILVSVENADAARGEALQRKVAEAIANAARNGALDAAVLSQVVSADDAALTALATQYGVSLGKAALIQEVITQAPTLTFEDLAPMTINEIALIAASRNVSGTSVTLSGAASDKAYIGQAEALNLACNHAGVAVEDVIWTEVELDGQNGIMIYEVEFETGTNKYEYQLHAVTGAVVTFESENRKHTASGGSDAESSAGSCIGESAAKQAALAHAGVAESSAAYVKCYLEYEDGEPAFYCVEFKVSQTEYVYEIDLYSGAVLDFDAENHGHSGSHDSGNGAAESASYIGESAALAAALNHAGVEASSLKETHVELDRDGDTMIYQVEFETSREEYEYKIDAATGAVLRAENH